MPQTEIDWTVTVECFLCDAPTHEDDALPMSCNGHHSLCEACAEQHATDCRMCREGE